MNNAGTPISVVAQWRLARNLFPIYSELTRNSQYCPPPPCSTFESDDRPESLQAIRQWFEAVDTSLSPARFRAALQAANALNNDSTLHAIAQHFLARRNPSPEAREKLDFLLVRYFSVCSPPSFHSRTLSRRAVGEVLQPLVGDCAEPHPAWLAPLDSFLEKLERPMAQLPALLTEVAAWKASLGERYFQPIAAVELTHFHYLLHLVTVEAVDNALSHLVKEMEAARSRGTEYLDCTGAGMSARESLAALIEKWKSWVVPQDVEFWLDELAAMLLGVEKALGSAAEVAADSRVEMLLGEVGRMRALAETMTAQLSALTQRLQRLEARVELNTPWTPSAEATAAAKFRSPMNPPPVLTRPEVFASGRSVDSPPNDTAVKPPLPPVKR